INSFCRLRAYKSIPESLYNCTPAFNQSANSSYLFGLRVPPFLVVCSPSVRVAFSSPGQLKLDCHLRSSGGLQTVKINLRSTPYSSAFALSPSTTGFCFAQSASWPALGAEIGRASCRERV